MSDILTQEILDELRISNICSIDAEWNPDDTWHQKRGRPGYHDAFELWGAGLSYYKNDEIVAYYFRKRECLQTLLNFVCTNKIPMVCHFGQADVVAFIAAGYTFPEDPDVRCTAIAYNLMFENWRENQLNLKKHLIPTILKKERAGFLECAHNGPDSPEFVQYAKDDVIDQLTLYTKGEAGLKKLNLFKTYMLITKSIVPFSEMIYEGMPFDVDEAEDLYHKLSTLRDGLEETFYSMLGRVNLGSAPQLQKLLFEKNKYFAKGLKKNKTGFSTDAGNIEKLAEKYPACEILSAWRTCDKMISTYIKPLLNQWYEYGRVYDWYFLDSKTGRVRAKMFTLIPKSLGGNIKFNMDVKAYFEDLNLRKMFKVKEGKKLVVRDFSSLEYRTAAAACKDPTLLAMYKKWDCKNCNTGGSSEIPLFKCPNCSFERDQDIFNQGQDLHNFVKDIANKYGANVTRSKAKNISFCVVFNGTVSKLVSMLNLDHKTCAKIQSAIFGKIPKLKEWQDHCLHLLETQGEIYNLFGRRRKINLKEDQSKFSDPKMKDWIKKNSHNMFVNFDPQSSGVMIAQIATRNTRKMLIKKGLWDRAKICAFVHDEIHIECDEEISEEVNEILQYEMEMAVNIGVPLLTEGSIGDSWYEAK